MKKRVALETAVSLAVSAMAQSGWASGIAITQSFASQPAGWTASTSNGGSTSFTTFGLASYAFAPAATTASVTADEVMTTSAPPSTYVENGVTAATIVTTFNTYFNTATPTLVRGADQGSFFSVYGPGNNAILNLSYSESGYFTGSNGQPVWQPSVSQGIYFGGQTTTTVPSSPPTYLDTYFNGQTLSVSVTTTITDVGPDPNANNTLTTWTISNTYTLIGPSFTFTQTSTSSEDTNSGYNPFTTDLSYRFGPNGYSDGLDPNNGGVQGDVEFNDLNVFQTVPTPEPTTLSLLALSSGALLRRGRRSRRARRGFPRFSG